MTFGYSFKTPDGVRHESTFDAHDKEEVFSKLRARGVKPIKVWPIRAWYHISKRTVVILILTIVVAVLLMVLRNATRPEPPRAMPRHQIYGDPEVLQRWQESGYAEVFAQEGNRILARFAQPGREEGFLVKSAESASALLSCLGFPVVDEPEDGREVRELKEIVRGMRGELKEYLSDGGTAAEYMEQLVSRQRRELAIYEQVRREMENERDEAVREAKNANLRALGIRTIPRLRKK